MRNVTIKALRVFKTFSEDLLLTFAMGVITSLTGNTFFPTAADLLAELKDANKAYADALQECLSGDRKCIAVKNDKKAELLRILTELQDLLNFVANGSKTMLVTTSYPLTNDGSRSDELFALPYIDITLDGNGSMTIKLKGVKGKGGLVYQYALDGDLNVWTGEPNWITLPCGDVTCTITNMPVGKRVLIRVGIWSAKVKVRYTDPVSRMVA